MAHNLTFNSTTGLWEVMTRGAAWHNLGQIVEGCKTWQETQLLAGLNWTVSKRQLMYNGIDVPAWGLFRDDKMADIETAFLTPTTETYQPIQNEFMFAFLDTMIEQDGGAHYESAGSMNGGNQVFALVNINQAFEIGNTGDRYESYLLFTDDRTGKRSAKCFMTHVRVVCANTLEQALSGENAAASVVFHHKKNVMDKLVKAAGMFTGARMNSTTLQSKLERLAERQMTRETMVSILDRLFPPSEKENATDARRAAKIEDLLKLYESNDFNMFPEVRGTAYNMLNAVTEYVDHFAPVRRTAGKLNMTDNQIRSERAMVGEGASFKQNALDIILEATAFAPSRKTVYSSPAGAAVGVIELEAVVDSKSVLDDVLAATVVK